MCTCEWRCQIFAALLGAAIYIVVELWMCLRTAPCLSCLPCNSVHMLVMGCLQSVFQNTFATTIHAGKALLTYSWVGLKACRSAAATKLPDNKQRCIHMSYCTSLTCAHHHQLICSGHCELPWKWCWLCCAMHWCFAQCRAIAAVLCCVAWRCATLRCVVLWHSVLPWNCVIVPWWLWSILMCHNVLCCAVLLYSFFW